MKASANAAAWLPGLLGVVLACAALPVGAEDAVYRWLDRNGQVNYGSEPPPGVRAERLGSRGNLSVLPALQLPTEPEPSGADDDRLERLEQELAVERRLRREEEARRAEDATRRETLRAECEARLREACDDEGRPVGRRYIVVPAHPGWPQPPRPPVVRPPQPPKPGAPGVQPWPPRPPAPGVPPGVRPRGGERGVSSGAPARALDEEALRPGNAPLR